LTLEIIFLMRRLNPWRGIDVRLRLADLSGLPSLRLRRVNVWRSYASIMRPVVKALRKIFDTADGVPLLLLVGYFDVLIIGGAALITHAVESHRQVRDNVALTCPAFDGASGLVPAHSDCGTRPALGNAMAREVAAGTPLQRMTIPYIWVRQRFRDFGD
jgi:hypothetical protein